MSLNQKHKAIKASYNKSEIMKTAWQIFRNNTENLTFSNCLRQSWSIAKNGIKDDDINTVYTKYYKQVYLFVLNRVGNKTHIAEEITNDVFIKFNNKITYDVYRAKILTLLYTMAKNAVIDYFRTAHADRFISVSQFCDTETGKETFQIVDNSHSDNVETSELSERINTAMSSLKPKYRQIAELFFMEQKKYNEIAEILCIPMGSVKGMINRVRAMLQESLQACRVE